MSIKSEESHFKPSMYESFKEMLQPDPYELTETEIAQLYDGKSFIQLLEISSILYMESSNPNNDHLPTFLRSPRNQNSDKSLIQELTEDPETVFLETIQKYIKNPNKC